MVDLNKKEVGVNENVFNILKTIFTWNNALGVILKEGWWLELNYFNEHAPWISELKIG